MNLATRLVKAGSQRRETVTYRRFFASASGKTR
jgi:hypothetical protein